MKKARRFRVLRLIVLLTILVGAGVSVGLTIYASRNNNSLVLPVLFAGWVLSPFIGMFLSLLVSRRWPDSFCKTLYALIIILSVVSLVFYSGLVRFYAARPAFFFLFVPLVSWISLVVFVPAAHSRSYNRSPQKGVADFFRGVK